MTLDRTVRVWSRRVGASRQTGRSYEPGRRSGGSSQFLDPEWIYWRRVTTREVGHVCIRPTSETSVEVSSWYECLYNARLLERAFTLVSRSNAKGRRMRVGAKSPFKAMMA